MKYGDSPQITTFLLRAAFIQNTIASKQINRKLELPNLAESMIVFVT